jgi:signal transduction histidine kinase/ActR/RegA family two-component response regulator
MDASRIECFAHMLGHLREPLLIATRDRQILAANVAGAEALGASVGVLQGASLAGYSPDPATAAEPLRPEMQFPLRGRDGRRFLCDACELGPDLMLLRLSGGPEADKRARDLIHELSTLGTLTAAGVGPADPSTRDLLQRCMSTVGAAVGGLFVVDRTGENLELRHSIGYGDATDDRFRLTPITARMPGNDALKSGEPIFLETAEERASRYPALPPARSSLSPAIAAIPLIADGKPFGVLGFGFPLDWTFGAEIRDLMRTRAPEWAREFMRRAEQTQGAWRDQMDRATSRLERLNALAGGLARAITPASVAEAVVDLGTIAASARAGGLWLLSDARDRIDLIREIGRGGPSSRGQMSFPLDGGMRIPLLEAIRSETPIWLESNRQIETQYPEMFRAGGCGGEETALACVPLFARGCCVGGLVYVFAGAHPFLEDERAFLLLLSRHSAQAIERARLYAVEKAAKEEAEANQRRSEFLARAGTVLAAPLDYSAMLTGVARAAVSGFADWCILEIQDEALQGEVPVAAHVDPEKVSFVVELSRRFRQLRDDHGIPKVIRSGKSELYRSISEEQLRRATASAPALGELYIRSGVASSMIVPVSARGRTLGAILLNRTRDSLPFGDEDLKTAEELGRRVGLAVENIRLFREAQRADRLKDEFLAMLSHELRNPLAPIVTALNVMGLRGDGAFGREREIIARHVRHLVRLVDDLLDVSRTIGGKVQLEKVRCRVSDLIAEAVEMASPLIGARAHNLTLAGDQGLEILADRTRLAQAIANLLINAAKYTHPGGSITVETTAEGAEAVIRVRDSGSGIAPEALPRVFDLFVQGRWSVDRAQGGLGVGLTVVKRVVELHGGSVSAHSAGLGQGSEFVVRLQRAPPSTPVPADARRAVDGRTSRSLRALVVDDNEDAATLMSDLLGLLGCTARIARDGASALAAWSEMRPDLALLDIGLPDMDGYELARQLRASNDSGCIFIALTGYGQDADRARSRAAGFSEHLLKPVEVDDLQAVLDRCRERQAEGTPPSA